MARIAVCNVFVLLLLVFGDILPSTTACWGGGSKKKKTDHNNNPSTWKGRPSRFVQEGTDGILLARAVENFDRNERWETDYLSLLAQGPSGVTALFNIDVRTHPNLYRAYHEADHRMRAGEYEENLRSSHLSALSRTHQTAIAAYTLEDPNMYRDFNRRTRELLSDADWQEYPYRGLLAMLNAAIETLGYRFYPLTVFRGVDRLFGTREGEAVMFQQVSSTSTNREMAETFTVSESPERGTLFVMTVRHALGIRALSRYPGEEEFIIRSHEHFKVTAIRERQNFREIHLESLENMDHQEFKTLRKFAKAQQQRNSVH